ncbi:unnamed protein product [Arctogadus glacialis]
MCELCYCKYCRYSLSKVERELKTYLFSSRNILIMDETVKRLRLGWTLPSFPHSQTMVYDMVHQSGSYVIGNNVPCTASSTTSSSMSLSSSSSSTSASCSTCIHACKVLKMAYCN